MGGRGASLSDRGNAKALRSKIKKNESIIEKYSRENIKIYESVSVSDSRNPKWKKWRANNKKINSLKRENAKLSIKARKLEDKINPPKPRKYINGFGEATHREISTLTYERAIARQSRDFDRWFGNRR